MRVAFGVRTAGICVVLVATALAAACRNDEETNGSAVPAAGPREPVATTRAVTNATVSWEAPTENTNGSPVGTLGGYRIHYGTASGQYTMTIDVANPGLTTYVIDNLDVGITYYFAVAAVSAAGVEGALSPEIAAVIS